MSDLSTMSINDIFDNIGVSLNGKDLDLILNHNEEALAKIRELFDKSAEMDPRLQTMQYMFNAEVIRSVFREFEWSVDKDLLVMLTLYNHQSILESGKGSYSENQRKSFKKYISNAIRLIGRNDIRLIDFEYDLWSNLIKRVKVINSQELIKAIKSGNRLDSFGKMHRKEIERIEKVDADVDLDNVTQTLILDDIRDIASVDPEIGSSIVTQISDNALRQFARTHKGIDEDVLNGNKPLDEELEKELKTTAEYRMTFSEGVKANLKYIDIDKLLLVSAFRYIDMLENDEKGEVRVGALESDKEITRESSIEIIREIIESMSRNISRGTVIEGVIGLDETKRTYSLESLESDLSRFVEGDYIRKATIQKAKEDVLLGEKTLRQIDTEVEKRIVFSEEEIISIIKASEENVIYLIENNRIETKEIYTILHLRNGCSLKLFKVIIDRCMLNGAQILKLYEYGIIGLEHIKVIGDKELLDSINVGLRVKEICVSIQDSEESEKPKKIEHFNKIAALYKMLKLEGKSKEEIEEISNGLIGSFEEDLNSEMLERLYQFGIISLDIAADWGIDLTELMSKGEMKPIDLRRLYDNKTIRIAEIESVLLNSELSYEEKLDLIYSTFDGESEEEYNAREELIQLLENGESYRGEAKQTGTKRNIGTGTKAKEYITDPHARWKLISLLDKEYSRKFLPKGREVIDGHRVFLLPNLDRIVIERMYENRAGRKVNAYGSATYIMETEEFFKDIDEIIVKGAINRTYLRELSEAESATKIIHSRAWGESIKRYFGINEENERYSEKEIEEIDTAIANVNISRKERESK